MPETQVKRLHDPFIKIINNLFAVLIILFIFVHISSLSICACYLKPINIIVF